MTPISRRTLLAASAALASTAALAACAGAEPARPNPLVAAELRGRLDALARQADLGSVTRFSASARLTSVTVLGATETETWVRRGGDDAEWELEETKRRRDDDRGIPADELPLEVLERGGDLVWSSPRATVDDEFVGGVIDVDGIARPVAWLYLLDATEFGLHADGALRDELDLTTDAGVAQGIDEIRAEYSPRVYGVGVRLARGIEVDGRVEGEARDVSIGRTTTHLEGVWHLSSGDPLDSAFEFDPSMIDLAAVLEVVDDRFGDSWRVGRREPGGDVLLRIDDGEWLRLDGTPA